MSKIKFLGAAGEVTGSAFLLTLSATQILIDFGIFQGGHSAAEKNRHLDIDTAKLDAVLLTHAHIDHCGRLPFLVRKGYRGPIYMTQATREILEIALLDAVKVSQEKTNNPLFGTEAVHQTLQQAKIVNYEEEFRVGEASVSYHDAGHILGSASIKISAPPKQFWAFSGDLGNTPEEIVRPTVYIDQADFVVMESTYGGRRHSSENPVQILAREIQTVENLKGTLLIPAFSIERTQTILHMIDHLKKEGGVGIATPVYLDSPMAIKTTFVYERHPELYSDEVAAHAKIDPPFDFPGLSLITEVKESQDIFTRSGPKVIIAGSGMMTGGRILDHALNSLSSPKTRILFVGYQAQGTLGREILDGASTVKIKGRKVEVKAKVQEITALSAHADEAQLLTWLSKIKPVTSGTTLKVFLVHGDDPARAALHSKIHLAGRNEVILPNLGQEFET